MPMNHVPFFTVLPGDERPPKTARNQAFLAPDNWNDWHEFRTLYQLSFVDASGAQHYVGGVKIGQFGTFLPGGRPQIPTAFDTLSEEFFSLGQSDEYYERLNLLGATVRGRVLSGLCDVALDLPRFDRAVFTAVMQRSLLRSITENTVRVQFHRMANGGARLSAYEFVFSTATSGPTDGLALEFSVTPNSRPPTNIHVLIGRNGVGKTRTLTSMVRSLVDDVGLEYGVFSLNGRQSRSSQLFSNVVSVTFSAFDNFVPPRAYGEAAAQRRYTYIGLNQGMGAGRVGKFRPKDHRALADEFGESVAQCSEGARLRRWKRAMHTLESDPMFKEFGITDLPAEASEERQGSTALASNWWRRERPSCSQS
ncbi:MAG: hypothetical protein M5U28_13475 [Sandaracinaceae bacterium]|nr:hypothetical protein [Sandaracinaceae bacterium]